MAKWRLKDMINREEYERVCGENRELKSYCWRNITMIGANQILLII